jgi:CMP-N-acetylneuraminic acid synthetase
VHLSKPLQSAVVRRQDAPKCYDMNASIYVWRRDVLLSGDALFNSDTRLYVMPEERSIDIDSELDFRFVESLMTANPDSSR